MMLFWYEIYILIRCQPPTPIFIFFPTQLVAYSKEKEFQFSVVSQCVVLSGYNRGILCISKASLLCSLAPLQHTYRHIPHTHTPKAQPQRIAGGKTFHSLHINHLIHPPMQHPHSSQQLVLSFPDFHSSCFRRGTLAWVKQPIISSALIMKHNQHTDSRG